jgi:3-hydroxypropanoate dehydrogenase
VRPPNARPRVSAVSIEAAAQLFEGARTHRAWLDKPVDDHILRRTYELAKWGPTSANTCPLGIVFVRSSAAKETLLSVVAETNRDKTRAAPVTAIFSHDLAFYERWPQLSPHSDLRPMFAGKPALVESTAFRNGALQAGYFILAARALGLDVGPMSGFDNARCDEAFMAGTTWRSNFLCNLGHGDIARLLPRAPRLEFEDVCKVV